MNTQFTPSGSHVIDPSGKEWPTEVWHPCPSPWFNIDKPDGYCVKADPSITSDKVYWLVRRPLPPLPKELSQEERDEKALHENWMRNTVDITRDAYRKAFTDGVAYARSQPSPTRTDDELFEEWINTQSRFTWTREGVRLVFNSILSVIRKETK